MIVVPVRIIYYVVASLLAIAALAVVFQVFFRYEYLVGASGVWSVDRLTHQTVMLATAAPAKGSAAVDAPIKRFAAVAAPIKKSAPAAAPIKTSAPVAAAPRPQRLSLSHSRSRSRSTSTSTSTSTSIK
jgi:hypothetical protein